MMCATSSRRFAKRKTRATYRRLDTAMVDVLELKDMFEGTAPEYVQLLENLATGLLVLQEQIVAFYTLAWGEAPGDWYSDA